MFGRPFRHDAIASGRGSGGIPPYSGAWLRTRAGQTPDAPVLSAHAGTFCASAAFPPKKA